jgi:hypothetical protein
MTPVMDRTQTTPLTSTATKRSFANAIGADIRDDDEREGKRRHLMAREQRTPSAPTTTTSVRSILTALGQLTSPLADAAQTGRALARAPVDADIDSDVMPPPQQQPQATRPSPRITRTPQRFVVRDVDAVATMPTASEERAPPTRTLELSRSVSPASAAERRNALAASDGEARVPLPPRRYVVPPCCGILEVITMVLVRSRRLLWRWLMWRRRRRTVHHAPCLPRAGLLMVLPWLLRAHRHRRRQRAPHRTRRAARLRARVTTPHSSPSPTAQRWQHSR